IDYYDESPAAGVGTYLSDSPAYNTIELPSRLVPKTASFCCRITGDSMEPTYPKYCKVFVEARPMIESGEDGIFVYNGTSVFKRLLIDQKKGIMRLTSINPTGPTFEVGEGDDVYTVGKVVGIYVPEEMK
ncbi:MAG: hypothetical protein LBR85_09810, partial [Oscillospiraceae bacterium]|nr:hypothetical protein [Oscillospiraceae bacterium]